MYVYHEYFSAEKVALLFPANEGNIVTGNYLSPTNDKSWFKECSILPIAVDDNIKQWQRKIGERVHAWMMQ